MQRRMHHNHYETQQISSNWRRFMTAPAIAFHSRDVNGLISWSFKLPRPPLFREDGMKMLCIPGGAIISRRGSPKHVPPPTNKLLSLEVEGSPNEMKFEVTRTLTNFLLPLSCCCQLRYRVGFSGVGGDPCCRLAPMSRVS